MYTSGTINHNSEYKIQNMAQKTLLASMNAGFGVHTTTCSTVYNDQFNIKPWICYKVCDTPKT